ncbi:MAG: Fur family transcriptional regulator [Candidatus Nanopelagicales bacterium]
MSEQWADQLRACGHRATSQRILVLEVIAGLRHATPDQVLAEARRRGSAIDLSTVYRTLELLDEVGLITHAHLGHGSPTYHPIDERPHIHLVCRRCNRVSQIDAVTLDPMVSAVAEQSGFVADVGHLVLHGVCAECADGDVGSDPEASEVPGLSETKSTKAD